jgi:teichuronic acid exporter
MKEKNLREKTITGFKWSFIDNVGKYGGQFIIGIILTRLLTPEDFGLIGMITIFIVIGQSLTNSGFGQALIQKKNADNTDFSTVFYFNILASSTIYLIIFLSAPLIARFYNQPEIIPLVKVICLAFVIDAIGRIHQVYLEKQLDFKSPSIIGVTSVLISGAISITMAYLGFGVWALVANTVIRSAAATVMLWIISSWRPLIVFSKRSLKTLFMFGSKILVAGLMQSFFHNIYYLIIGRFFSAQSLGYYTRAASFKDMPVSTITIIIQKVTFPVFSTIQDDDDKLISGYTKAIRMLLVVVMPFMVMIFITSRPLIFLVLGEKWMPVVPYLKVMVLYGWIYVLYTINNQIITVKGRSDYYLQMQVLDKVFIIISILVTYRYGIMAMIYGHMAATVLAYLIESFYLKKVIDISLAYQLKHLFPFIFASSVMLLSSIPVAMTIENDLLYLAVSIIVSVSVYLLMLWLLKIKELSEGFTLIKTFMTTAKLKKYNK